MANRQTRRLLKLGKSLKFNHGVDCTGADHSDRPEITIVDRPLPRKGECVNSSVHAGKPYCAPTITKKKRQ